MTAPTVGFTDERLPNGLRVIIAEDHLAPVVAVCIWYDVGSKHEVEGKTGFAHLFEHVMFQGSRHVAKTEHMSLVQAAGGTMNGTTWLDRTNYFETMPSHQLELALWLEADRMGTLLDALNQANLDNQRKPGSPDPRPAHVRNFLACVKSRQQPVLNLDIGHHVSSVAHLGNIAYRTGRKIVWDAANEKIVNDHEADKLVGVKYRQPWKLPYARRA